MRPIRNDGPGDPYEGVKVTWLELVSVHCETSEDVYELLLDLSEDELKSSRVWSRQRQRAGPEELALLRVIFEEG